MLNLSYLPPILDGQINLGALPQLLAKDNPLIMDIGCNDGTHTNIFLNMFSNSKVFSFEPDSRAQKRYKKNVLNSRATLFQLALSNVDGITDFYISEGMNPLEPHNLADGWDYSGSIRRPTGHLEDNPWCQFANKSTVITKKLDTFSTELGLDLIDFIWADVQGAEVDLINGGLATLAKTRYIYTEYSDKELYEGQIDLRTLVAMLPDYEIMARWSGDVLLKNKNL